MRKTVIMNQTPDLRPCAETLAQFCAAPDRYRSITGIPPEIAARLPGFADFQIDGETLVEAVRRAGPQMGPATPTWAPTLMSYGDELCVKGERAEALHDGAAAECAFLEASFWYFFARFPHILNAAGAEAYRRHVAAYLRAAKHFENPVEAFETPFERAVLKGHLRLPKNAPPSDGWPLVVLWGGIDVWKSDLEIHSQSNALLRHEIATLAVDMPGTGECPFPVRPDGERVLAAILTAIRTDDRIDPARVGCYGLSFGGHWAAKMALVDPSLSGVVNVAGPIHHTFQPAWIAGLPLGAKMALARVQGIDLRANPDQLTPALGKLDLVAQGLIPASRSAPLLSVNGEMDELVPIADLDVLSDYGVHQDRLKFANDRHVASRNWRLHESFVAEWLARKLRRSPAGDREAFLFEG
jgi:esterase FrsA